MRQHAQGHAADSMCTLLRSFPQDWLKLHVHRSLPMPCQLCPKTETSTSGRPNLYKSSVQVYHGK